jgi:hypothetical protein
LETAKSGRAAKGIFAARPVSGMILLPEGYWMGASENPCFSKFALAF